MDKSEFDKILREKVKNDHSLFEHEIKQSKPLVWSAIEKELNPSRMIVRRSYLAAAVIILLIGIGALFYYNQLQYSKELDHITLNLKSMKEIYEGQNRMLSNKVNELNCLQQELILLEKESSKFENIPNKNTSPIYVYQRDTVVIKQIEYIKQYEVPIAEKLDSVKTKENIAELPKIENQSSKVTDAIYPSFNTTSKVRHEMNSLKIKVNALVAN